MHESERSTVSGISTSLHVMSCLVADRSNGSITILFDDGNYAELDSDDAPQATFKGFVESMNRDDSSYLAPVTNSGDANVSQATFSARTQGYRRSPTTCFQSCLSTCETTFAITSKQERIRGGEICAKPNAHLLVVVIAMVSVVSMVIVLTNDDNYGHADVASSQSSNVSKVEATRVNEGFEEKESYITLLDMVENIRNTTYTQQESTMERL
eukprot:m.9938 g.9938  ORF g.9938 m.9938 type:complete len:212 (-) comp7092_c0_seq1:1227-1862(-)